MHRSARPFAALAFALLACTSQPSSSDKKTENQSESKPEKPETTTGTQPIPEPEGETDEFEIGPGKQVEPLTTAVIDAPIPTEQPPLDFWTKGDAACEPGGRLDGAAPPAGTEIRCIDAEYRWTGMEARFHENGKLQSIGRRQESRMIGVWLSFHPSGNKAAEQTYVDGQLHGTIRRWADNGQELEYGEYRGGRPWGLFIDRDENGNELARAQLDKGTGMLVNASISTRSESDHVDGLLHGTLRTFDANNRKLEESLWSGGEMHGTQTRWDAEGNKHFEGQWKNGEQHGEFTRFAAGQIIEQSIYLDGKEISKQLFRDGQPLAPLPARTECDTDPGLSKYLASARGEGLPDDHACVTRVPMFPGVIMLGSFAYDRGCMGADYVVDCKMVNPGPSAAALLVRAGWAKASGEQRIEIAKEYVREFALGNNGSVTHDPTEPEWKVLEDGGVEGVVWVAEPAGMRRGVDKDQIRYTFAADGTVKHEVLKHLAAQDD
jgi:antitoxin component YwqK of YwqJK toxin-antitoxin module